MAAWVIAAVGGVIAAFKAVAELKRGHENTQNQYRWRRTKEARDIIDAMNARPLSANAMRMLDWSGRSYKLPNGEDQTVKWNDVYRALRTEDLNFTLTEVYIRDCFDSLFDDFERVEQFINSGLIAFDDVGPAIEYYVSRMSREQNIFEDFMGVYEFEDAIDFCRRFPAWGGGSGADAGAAVSTGNTKYCHVCGAVQN